MIDSHQSLDSYQPELKTGTVPRTVQTAMRHNGIKLTMGVYTADGLSTPGDVRGRGRGEVVWLQGHWLNLRLLEEIDADTYACKAQELRDEETELRLNFERCRRGRNELIDIAVKAFEFSQNLRTKWFAADNVANRRSHEILCLNWKLVGVSLVPEMRKPFDLVAEGFLQKASRAGGI
jgi:hypothetical protein